MQRVKHTDCKVNVELIVGNCTYMCMYNYFVGLCFVLSCLCILCLFYGIFRCMVFQCNNVRQVPRSMFIYLGFTLVFQHLQYKLKHAKACLIPTLDFLIFDLSNILFCYSFVHITYSVSIHRDMTEKLLTLTGA